MTTLVLDLLRSRRGPVLALVIGILAICIGYLSTFPALEEQLQAFAGDLPDFYDALIGEADFTTPRGYVQTQVYALIAPLVASGVCIAIGASLAQRERDVTLTPYYLAPVSRATLALSGLVTTWVVALLAGIAILVGVVIGAPIAGAELPLGSILAATVPFVGIAGTAGTVAWLTACATGSPAAAGGAGWAFVATSFLANSVGEVVTDARVLTDVSPWGWYGAGSAITTGFQLQSLLLFLLAAVLVPVGVRLFDTRELQL